jgi:hypothetical protein
MITSNAGKNSVFADFAKMNTPRRKKWALWRESFFSTGAFFYSTGGVYKVQRWSCPTPQVEFWGFWGDFQQKMPANLMDCRH